MTPPRQGARRMLPKDEVVAEVEHLGNSDAPENIARRLGFSRTDSVARALMRAGRNDLAVKFGRVA